MCSPPEPRTARSDLCNMTTAQFHAISTNKARPPIHQPTGCRTTSAIASSPDGAGAVRFSCATLNVGWSPLDMVQRHSRHHNFGRRTLLLLRDYTRQRFIQIYDSVLMLSQIMHCGVFPRGIKRSRSKPWLQRGGQVSR
jgi:hypothetical protein